MTPAASLYPGHTSHIIYLLFIHSFIHSFLHHSLAQLPPRGAATAALHLALGHIQLQLVQHLKAITHQQQDNSQFLDA
jgi:hypothetical protein